jgi:LuxR family maltose regulon positive regulatory protein
MKRLLGRARDRDPEARFVEQLLAAFSPAQPVAAPVQGVTRDALGPLPTMIEELSEREHEVLELIAEGLTNREIAQRLYIAAGTVKAHTSSIYGKLDVHSRTQAVARAHALGILISR